MQRVLLVLLAFAAYSVGGTIAQAEDAFQRDIGPILQKHCSECHGDEEPEAKLRLSSQDGLLYGSRSGRVVVPGQAAASMLVRLLAADAKPHMPPEGQLTDAEIATVSQWVNRLSSGDLPRREAAASSDHWAYQPLAKPSLPAVKHAAWVRDPLDRFVLAKLEAAGLEPAQEADPATLCRRLYFDLVGLPPTPDEMQAFVKDHSAPAYAALVEKLLASPHYGERWGRHWLDLARYADSAGYHEDLDRPYAWKYRDYVIASFNDDKPYAQFVTEQLAGDELDPQDATAWTATGFCRCGPSNEKNMGKGAVKEKYRLDLLDDVLSTTSAVFLGQTIGCARCHDHKLDPITQAEYYQLLSVFDTTEWVDVALDDKGSPSMVHTMAEKRKLEKAKTSVPWSIMALTETTARPRTTHLLWRGDVLNQGPTVEPGVPAVMAIEPLVVPTSPGDAKTTGRRKALAAWITSPNNPLTWRVVANRIWQHHLGDGIVATPSNFGRSGARPTHPELLDYLAQQMLSSGGSWKAMHRRIVMSATYRQAGAAADAAKSHAHKIDPENHLLWHANQRRLEAEVLRDSVLAVAGTLNEHVGGPGVKPRIRPELLVASQRNKWPEVKQEGPEHWRRSVYIYVKRQLPFPMLELFDQPNAAQTCERRDENVVPTQALVLMNDEFIAEQAGRFADRVAREAGNDFAPQVGRAVQIALGRQARSAEITETVAYLDGRAKVYHRTQQDDAAARRSAMVDFCHVLMNCNEFTYID
jgi:mono/diheme cytochrome c family protein